jgi:hypothetical protein
MGSGTHETCSIFNTERPLANAAHVAGWLIAQSAGEQNVANSIIVSVLGAMRQEAKAVFILNGC